MLTGDSQRSDNRRVRRRCRNDDGSCGVLESGHGVTLSKSLVRIDVRQQLPSHRKSHDSNAKNSIGIHSAGRCKFG